MEYHVKELTANTCRITLTARTPSEEKLLKEGKDQDTISLYYADALEEFIHPSATLIKLVEYSSFPSPVTVQFQIAKGIGE